MGKYMSRDVIWLGILTVICSIAVTVGAVFAYYMSNNVWSMLLIISGGMLFVIFFTCCIAEMSRTLFIDGEKIILPRGTEKNGNTTFRKTVVRLDEITSIESTLYKGDGIISKDCRFHTLKLKNGTKVAFTLYAYGKRAEKEIIEILRNSINR